MKLSNYTDYKEVNQKQLQEDIDAIKKTLTVGQEDFDHLLKLERWGRGATIGGFMIIALVVILTAYDSGINNFDFWFFGLIGAILVGVGNVARWANVTHPILHGAYDKVPNIPLDTQKKVMQQEIVAGLTGLTG